MDTMHYELFILNKFIESFPVILMAVKQLTFATN